MSQSVINTSMSGPIASSILFHIIVVGLFMAGTPYMKDDPVIVEQSVSVEIADISELTQTNRAPLEAPTPPRKSRSASRKPLPPEALVQKRASIRKPSVPKQVSTNVPKPSPPQKPKLEESIAKIREPEKPAPVPDPELEKPDSEKEKPEKKTEKKVDPEEQSKRIESLLVSLVGEEEPVKQDLEKKKPQPQDETKEEIEKEEAQPEPAPRIARLSDKLTVSEEDALRHQLSQCWNVLAGARDAEDLVVKVRLTVNPDRTVRSARLIDNGRYSSDRVYRAAADAALRAVRNPRCSPLKLPPDKFEQWETIIVRFDPSQML